MLCCLYETPFLLTTHSNSSVLNFELGVQTYPLGWLFFFCTLATAFPTSYHIKTICSFWVWKLSNDAFTLNLVPSASFLMQSYWLEKKTDQLLFIRKEAFRGWGWCLLRPWCDATLLAMYKCFQKRFCTSKDGIVYRGTSVIIL